MSFNESSIDYEYLSFGQKLELEADLQAAEWIINFKNKNLAKDWLIFANEFHVVIEIFAMLYLIQDNCEEEKEDKDESHPPVETRVLHIYSKLKNRLSETERKSIEKMLEEFNMGFDFPKIKITEELDNKLLTFINNDLFKN